MTASVSGRLQHNARRQQFSELMREGFRPGPVNPFGRVLEGEAARPYRRYRATRCPASETPDCASPWRSASERSWFVPLRKDNVLLGVITANRREVRPFTEKQIALLQRILRRRR